jgi:hypothetical protein
VRGKPRGRKAGKIPGIRSVAEIFLVRKSLCFGRSTPHFQSVGSADDDRSSPALRGSGHIPQVAYSHHLTDGGSPIRSHPPPL